MSSLNKHTEKVLHKDSVYQAHCYIATSIISCKKKSTSEVTHKVGCEQKQQRLHIFQEKIYVLRFL